MPPPQLAERLGNKFGYVADLLMPTLLRQTFVNIKVRRARLALLASLAQ